MMPVWLNCNKKKKKKTNTLDDKETFLSANSWIFTIAILWGPGTLKIERLESQII
jgi:hypothetical protein